VALRFPVRLIRFASSEMANAPDTLSNVIFNRTAAPGVPPKASA